MIIDQVVPVAELEMLSRLGLAQVLIDHDPVAIKIPIVRTDYRKAMQTAAAHLIGLGHRRIAILPGSLVAHSVREMVEGYKEALVESGGPVDLDLIPGEYPSSSNWTTDMDTVSQVLKNLRKLAEPPTAFLCTDDWLTLAFSEFLRQEGIRIPQDISVIGVSASEPRLLDMLGLGAIMVPCYEMGMQACQLLLNLLQGKKATREIVLEATLEPRKTCAPPPVRG